MNVRRFRKPGKKQSKFSGVTLDCACVHCDYYQYDIRLGEEIKKGYHYYPAFHTVKRKIVQINICRYLKVAACLLPEMENPELERMRKRNVIPYFEKGMFEQNGVEMEILSVFPHLQSKFNLCPLCGKFGLQFCLEEHLD
jgi:hypothetical protein